MELRRTETNAADDSRGQAFGLEGNLYLVIVIAVLVALALLAWLGFVWRTGWVIAAVLASCPVMAVLFWALILRRGRPPGYDRDWVEQRLGGGNFTRDRRAQQGLVNE